MFGLARLKQHLFEGHQLLLGPWKPGLLIVDVDLHCLQSLDVADIADGHDQLDGSRCSQFLGAQRRSAVLERRVRKPVTEREEGCNLGPLVVPVANIDSFAVGDLVVLARPVVERGSILESLRECALLRC